MGWIGNHGPYQGAALMKRTTKYTGLDVHQATTVASVRERGGRVIARAILPTEEQALVEFFGNMRGTIHVAFEEGTQAQWLYDLLEPVVDRVVVCNRRGEGRGASKDDKEDADDISHRLRLGGLKSVYHGSPHRAQLQELARTYRQVVEDSTRVMQRLKALLRARGVRAPGRKVYHPDHREEWLAKLPDEGMRFRARALYRQLDLLRELRPEAKAKMVAEARRDPAWPALTSIPYLGPVRVALLLAVLRTPWRFRTKGNLCAYAGFAVVKYESAQYEMADGRPVRRRRRSKTRGLNRNRNPIVKNIFKGAAAAAIGRPGSLQDYYHGLLAGGMREDMARVTLARKLVAVTLRLWKTGERYDPEQLTRQAD